jgi:glucokinase
VPPPAIALDVGGTKVRAALISKDGVLLAGSRYAAEAARGAAHVLSVMEGGIEEMRAQAQIAGYPTLAGIGISSAGVIDPQDGHVVSSAPQIPGWEGQRLGAHFVARFGLSVVADNDANCALLGEVWRGGHAPLDHASASAVMLTLGTGLGGALCVNGGLVTGRHHLTGHYGIARMWDPVSATEVKVEHLISGTGLGNVYRQIVQGAHAANGLDVIERVSNGDADAMKALSHWAEHLALLLHNTFWQIDPDLILLGGGMADSASIWMPVLQESLARRDTRGIAIPIAVASLGNDAGVFGAAKRVFDAARGLREGKTATPQTGGAAR